MADMGQITHEIEMITMDFLRKQGINPDYNEVENYVDEILAKYRNNVITLDELGISYVQFEEMCGDLDDKANAIDCACSTLANMKRIVNGMRKSDMKTTLLSYIEDMETDLD